MIGRPSIMTVELVGKLRVAFLMGCSDREACLYAGINKDTLYDYQKRNPDFTDQKQLWKQNPMLKARITIFNALNQPKIAMWFMERKRPEEFSLRYTSVQHTTNILIQCVNPLNGTCNFQHKQEDKQKIING